MPSDPQLNSPKVNPAPERPRLLTPRHFLPTALEKLTVTRKTLAQTLRAVMEYIEKEGFSGEDAQRRALHHLRALIEQKAPDDDKAWMLAAVDEGVMEEMIEIIIYG